MIPRLTKPSRKVETRYRNAGAYLISSRPSPAERLRQRRKAKSSIIRTQIKIGRAFNKRVKATYRTAYDLRLVSDL